jgi:hypothetical protein
MRLSGKNYSSHIFFIINSILLICLIPVSGLANDDSQAFVAVKQGSKTSVVRGEKLSFYIKLSSKTMFSGSPRFELPIMNNGLLYKVQDRPVLGTEKVKGVDYATQLHEFWFFPKVSGEITIPEVNVSFSTPSGLGAGEQQHKMKTGPLSITVAPLPGVPDDTVIIATDAFTIKQSWRPEVQNGVVGDAVIRTITMRAKNTASIFLPEIGVAKIPGVSIYKDPAEVDDKNERGEATAQRKDSITYLFETEGKYTLDSVSVRWWDSGSQKLQEDILEGLTIEIAANPDMLAPQSSSGVLENQKAGSLNIILICLGLAGLVLAVLLKNKKKIQRKYNRFKSRPQQVEKTLFKKLKLACAKNNKLEVYNLFIQWGMHTCGPGFTPSIFMQNDEFTDMSQEITKLHTLLFARKDMSKDCSWSGKNFLKIVRKVRKKLRRQSKGPEMTQVGWSINY